MNKKGFTLIELLVVIAILSLLVIVVATNGFGALNNSKKKINELAEKEIQEALNVLMTEIEHCEEGDKILLTDERSLSNINGIDSSGRTYITCKELKIAASKANDTSLLNNELTISFDYLIENGYVTGSNANKLYKSIKDKNENINFSAHFVLSDKSFEKGEDNNVKLDDNGKVIISDFVFEDVILSTDELDNVIKESDGDVNDVKLLKDIIINSAKKAKEEGSGTRTIFYDETETLPTIPGKDISGVNERVLAIADDDLGKSYYFRGNVIDNYVEFNNMCFRIVRIEGDGSVKIILAKQDLCSTITGSDSDTAFIGQGDYGYTNNYFDDYENSENRTTSMNYILNSWFNEKLYGLSNKIKQMQVCVGDRTAKYDYYGNYISEDDIAIKDSWFYNNYNVNNFISMRCNNGKTTNMYKVYSLTAQEIVYAGAKKGSTNSTYYLLQNAKTDIWWTNSVSFYSKLDGNASYAVGNDGYFSDTFGKNNNAIRPAISLISGIEINSGDGTKNNPYVIK